MFKKIKHVSTKLFLLGFVLPGLAFLGIIAFAISLAVNANVSELRTLNSVATTNVAREIEDFLLQEARVLETIAYSPCARNYLLSLRHAEDHTDSLIYDDMVQYLSRLDVQDEEMDVLYIGSAFHPGVLFSDDVVVPDDYDGRARQWYARALETRGGMGVTDVYVSAIIDDDPTNDIIVSLSWAIEYDGEVLGVVGMNYNFAKIIAVIEREFEQGRFISLFDTRSDELLHNPNYSAEDGVTFTDVLDELDYNEQDRTGLRNAIAMAQQTNETQLYQGARDVSVTALMAAPWIVTASYDHGAAVRDEIIYEITLLSLPVIVFLLILLFSIIVTLRGVVRPLKNVAVNLEELASGDADLTKSLSVVTADEVGSLAQNFNTFVGKLHELVTDVNTSVKSAESVKQNVAANVEETSSAIEEIAATITSVANQTGKLDETAASTSTSIEQISANISSIDDQITNQASMVEQSSAAVEEMIASIDNVARVAAARKATTIKLADSADSGKLQLEMTLESFGALVNQIKIIQEFVVTINNISNQTNLLSMNAAIEAAHAGDAGKGFAVVAEEIRKLADSAAQSAGQITSVINGITESVEATQTSTTSLSKSMTSLVDEVRQTSDAFVEIERSVAEVSQGNQEVLKASEEIRQITTEIKSASSEVAEGTRIILNDATQLKGISGNVTSAVTEISTGADEINHSMQLLSSLSSELAELIDTLSDKFGKFKLDSTN